MFVIYCALLELLGVHIISTPFHRNANLKLVGEFFVFWLSNTMPVN